MEIVSPKYLDQIKAAYDEPHRSYHNFKHIDEMLSLFAKFEAESAWIRTREVFLAIIYHDIVYTPGEPWGSNENKSAKVALEHLRQLSSVNVQLVVELINLTAMHGSFRPGDLSHDAALLLDIDMARLGAPSHHFMETNAGIDFEFRELAMKDPEKYKNGRRAFFTSLQKTQYIFLTPEMRVLFETQARLNIERMLKSLG
jgi:predicted metal-dependent HD superfamily phosphohydrolase